MFAAVVAIVSEALIFHKLGLGSIWRDEAFSVELAKESIPQILRVVLSVEGNMFFYYMVMHLWLGLLNIFHIRWSAFWVRVPSALGFVAASITFWRLADYLMGRIGGLVAAVTWWAFPWAVTYGQQARSFSFFYFFTTLSYYGLIRFVDAQDVRSARRWAWVYGLATLLGVYSFMDEVFYTMTQVLWITWLWRRQRIENSRYIVFWSVTVAAALLSLPLVPSIENGGQVGWVPMQTIHDILRYPITWLSATPHSIIITWYLALGALLGPLLFLVFIRHGQPPHAARAVGLGLMWVITPLAIQYLVFRYLNFHILDAVYALPATLGVSLASSAGWMSIRRGPVVPWLILVITLVIGVPQWYRGQGISLENGRPSVMALARHVTPGQYIVCIDNIGGLQYTLQYFIDAHHLSISIPPYPGQFTWSEYINLRNKGPYFAEAASVQQLQRSHILDPGNQVWLALADEPLSLTKPLEMWLHHHAVLLRTIHEPLAPVTFQLYSVH